jgi:thiamine biosynthesis lipoprotein
VKKNKSTVILFTTVLLLLAGFFSACGKTDEDITRYEASFLDLFDTQSTIVGYYDDKQEFEEQVNYIYDETKIYHQLFDRYNNYEGINNLKTVNDMAGIEPVQVDQKIIDLLKYSKVIYELTDGKVNIAFGSVLEIWHDYRDMGIYNPEDAQVPPMDQLLEASLHSDINQVIIDEEAGTVFLEDPKMSLDVGAIAKGYAVEQVAQSLIKDMGTDSLLISLGGNVRAIGYKDHLSTPWNVGVKDDGTRGILHTMNLLNQSLVTSGNYQRYYVVDGIRYHHIIDPATLMPADHYVSVTILAADSGLADGLSTMAYILPLAEAKAKIEEIEGAEAIFVMKDGTLEYTDGFKDHIIK